MKAGKDIEAARVLLCPVCGNIALDEAPERCPILRRSRCPLARHYDLRAHFFHYCSGRASPIAESYPHPTDTAREKGKRENLPQAPLLQPLALQVVTELADRVGPAAGSGASAGCTARSGPDLLAWTVSGQYSSKLDREHRHAG